MLRLEWTTPAADQLEHAQDYYHALNPMAATLIAMRIFEAVQRHAGRPGYQPSRFRMPPGLRSREPVVAKTPYLLVYRVCADTLEVLHVWHEAQDWASRME